MTWLWFAILGGLLAVLGLGMIDAGQEAGAALLLIGLVLVAFSSGLHRRARRASRQ